MPSKACEFLWCFPNEKEWCIEVSLSVFLALYLTIVSEAWAMINYKK